MAIHKCYTDVVLLVGVANIRCDPMVKDRVAIRNELSSPMPIHPRFVFVLWPINFITPSRLGTFGVGVCFFFVRFAEGDVNQVFCIAQANDAFLKALAGLWFEEIIDGNFFLGSCIEGIEGSTGAQQPAAEEYEDVKEETRNGHGN